MREPSLRAGDLPLRPGREGVILSIHAQPGARKEGLAGLFDGRLRVRTTAPPVDGKANARILKFIAETLGLARRDVELNKGEKSRRKDLLLRGLDLEAATRRLEPLLEGSEA